MIKCINRIYDAYNSLACPPAFDKVLLSILGFSVIRLCDRLFLFRGNAVYVYFKPSIGNPCTELPERPRGVTVGSVGLEAGAHDLRGKNKSKTNCMR